MGRPVDVFKSLLRSAAQSATAPLSRVGLLEQLKARFGGLSVLHSEVNEQALSQAIGRLSAVSAATVRIGDGAIAVQMDLRSGTPHALTLTPAAISFAPRGAKEISFIATPSELANLSPSLDACAAIAGEVARTLWHPILRQIEPSEHLAFVHCTGNRLTADLRTVPEVRTAIRQAVAANLIDALSLNRLDIENGKLLLRLGLIGL